MDRNENVQPGPLNPDPGNNPGPPPSGDSAPPPASQDEAPLTIRQWLSQNAVGLLVIGGLLLFLYNKFDAEGLLAIGKAVLGLGLVVFIHELGHFLAAKWCDVHVTTFSIGFGPNVPGCSFVWGETTYKLGLIPLGGYVQMVGQVDGDESSDTASEEDPRSFRNKTVGQRMLIISAGVIMNVILAVLCFIIVYRGPGKDHPAAVIGKLETGGPTFTLGVRSGAEILYIDGVKDPVYYEDLLDRVVGSLEGHELVLKYKRPQDTDVTEILIEPKKVGDRNPMIGVTSADTAQLRDPRFKNKEWPAPVMPGSPASKTPVEFGDRIVGTSDPDNPSQIKALPDDPRYPNKGRRDFFELARRLQLLADQPVQLEIERGPDKQKVIITVQPAPARSLGLRMSMGQVANVRQGKDGPAFGKVFGPRPDPESKDAKPPMLQGDVIKRVEVSLGGGKTMVWDDKNLDPERLPFELRRWAATLDPKEPRKVKLQLKRHLSVRNERQFDENLNVELDWKDDWKFDRFLLGDEPSPLPIPELGLAYKINATVAGLNANGPKAGSSPLQEQTNRLQQAALDGVSADLEAQGKLDMGAVAEINKLRKQYLPADIAAALKPNDSLITKVQATVVNAKGEEIEQTASEVQPDGWAFWSELLLRSGQPYTRVTLWINGNKDKGIDGTKVELALLDEPDRFLYERGFLFDQDDRNDHADSIVAAVGMGFRHSYKSMVRVYRNLRGLILQRLSPARSLAGPLRMGEMAYRIARWDFFEFIFFLGLISINLAVINFLPIPVLDGGHMVFLIYEKLRGKPASEGIRVAATWAGVFLIFGLMLFVVYLDISHYMK